MPLRSPKYFTQAFKHRVQCCVLVVHRYPYAVELRANAGRLVDRQLLGDGKVQRQVEEWVDVPAFRTPIAIEIALRSLEDRVLLRVLCDQAGGALFEAGQRLACPIFCPRVEEKAARLVAGGIEQHSAYAVLLPNSQRSLIVHDAQWGDRATQT